MMTNDLASKNDFASLVNEACLDILSPLHAEVIQVRYGLLTGETVSLGDIAESFGIPESSMKDVFRSSRAALRIAAQIPLNKEQAEPTAAQRLWTMVNHYVGSPDSGVGARMVQFAFDSYPNTKISWLHFELFLIFYDLGNRPGGQAQIMLKVACIKALKYRKNYAPPGYVPPKYPLPKSTPPAALPPLKDRHVPFPGVIWPATPKKYLIEAYKRFQSLRPVQRRTGIDGRELSGTIISKKMSRDIQYESLLERDFYEQLEASPHVIWYVDQPAAIPYDIHNQVRIYYPDVVAFYEDGAAVMIEVKPLLEMACWKNWQKWKGLRAYCELNGMGFLITDGSVNFNHLVRANADHRHTAKLLKELESSKSFDWNSFVRFKKQFGITNVELAQIVISRRLYLETRPFALSLSR